MATPGKTFPPRKMDQDIHDAEVTRYLLRKNQSGEYKMLLQSEGLCPELQALAPGPVSDQQELQARAALEHSGSGRQQVVMAFQFEEAGNFPDDNIVRIDLQTMTQGGIILRLQKRREGKAAEDAAVLFGPSDAGGKILPGHGLGDTDEMSRDAGGETLGAFEEEIGNGALKVAKRGAMNGVNDNGHSGAGGGQPAEDSRLAAVGVDDLGKGGSEDSGQAQQCRTIVEGMDSADQSRHQAQKVRLRAQERGQRTFRAGGWPGDEIDLEIRPAPQAKDRCHRVFLCATDDQPGNDVRDPHPVEPC